MLDVAVLVTVALTAGEPRQDPPVFKSGVELVMVDAQVVDRKGAPVPGLTPRQFQVTIDGKRRTVVSAELIDANTGLPAGAAPADASAPAGTKALAAMPNVYILAVDQGSFRAVNAPSAVHAARELLKRAAPNDYVGMIGFPAPGIVVQPTRDRAPLETALLKLIGYSGVKQLRQYQYSLSDAVDVASRDADTRARVVQRNCAPNDRGCGVAVEMELTETVSLLEAQAARSLGGLRDVVDSVKDIPGRKIVVVLSAGIPTGDHSGGRLFMRGDATAVGKAAADAGILLYTLHLNTAFLDTFSPDAPSVRQTPMRDASVYAKALDIFNGTAGGTLMEVNASADSAMDRVMRETAAYYLLGLEVEEGDRDGRTHRIQVKVDSRGASVRSRASFVIPKR
jgi:VWFA-related protein